MIIPLTSANYKASAIKYWLELDHVIHHGPINVNLTQIQHNRIMRYAIRYDDIRSRWSTYQSKFMQKLESNNMFDIFMYISALGCGSDKYVHMDIKISNMTILPLTNGHGIFTIQEFMRAFIDNKLYIGIPSGFSTFDGYFGCPIEFVYHDMSHIRTMYSTIFSNNFEIKMESIRALYTYIENDKTITYEQRQILLFVTYWLIHESNNYFRQCTFNNGPIDTALDYELVRFQKINIPGRPIRISDYIDVSTDISFINCIEYFRTYLYIWIGRKL